jgi:formylglycine-generating enzyme required for sulfatase activity
VHVLRGGSFTNRLKYVRSADRDSTRPKYRYNFTGFRIAGDGTGK